MDHDIDIYEFDWWPICSAIMICVLLSLLLIVWSSSILQMGNDRLVVDAMLLLLLGTLSLVYSLTGLWTIYSVPKLIRFKQDDIHVVFPSGQEKSFPYQDISRIIIIGRVTKRNQVFTKSIFPFRVRIYFIDNTMKVMFNPDRMMDFSAVFEHIKGKGLGSIIEHK
jgi:hypothetical protein